jgi:HSP20 family protein
MKFLKVRISRDCQPRLVCDLLEALGTAPAVVAGESRADHQEITAMLVDRFNAFLPFEQLRREITRLLEGFDPLTGRARVFGAPRFPAVNVWEGGEHLYAEAEVPGVSQDGLEITVVGSELTIKGRRPPLEGENLSYHRQERGVGEFTRVLTLPVEIDAEKVQAGLKDGVLTLTLPKAEVARPRKINVKGS